MNIAIFCSANANIDPRFFTATEALGRWCAAHGHTVIFGGTNQGLMQCVAKAAHEAGARVVGVVPKFVEEGGMESAYMHQVYHTENLTDRKELLNSLCDVAIALPGGVGTLDEVFTLVAANTIGYQHKHVFIFNMEGFWNALELLLHNLQQQGMIRGDYRQYVSVVNSLDELQRQLEDYA